MLELRWAWVWVWDEAIAFVVPFRATACPSCTHCIDAADTNGNLSGVADVGAFEFQGSNGAPVASPFSVAGLVLVLLGLGALSLRRRTQSI